MYMYMNTNARGRLLVRFLAKIVIIYLILSASPLCKGWHGFLPPKKVLKTQNFHPAPRSHQPVPFFVIFLHLSLNHFFLQISAQIMHCCHFYLAVLGIITIQEPVISSPCAALIAAKL